MENKTFDELKKEAENIGFKFELQEWEADDYTIDDDEKEHWFKSKEKAWKVTFPTDYPRPADWIDINDDAPMVKRLTRLLKEYEQRFEEAKKITEHNRQVKEGMSKFTDMIRGQGSEYHQ